MTTAELRKTIFLLLLCFVSAIGGVLVYRFLEYKAQVVVLRNEVPLDYSFAALVPDAQLPYTLADFTKAAERATAFVVHISVGRRNPYNFGNTDFEPLPATAPYNNNNTNTDKIATGSGVIIKSNGLILTNNHVIEQGDVIQVTLQNKQTYTASLIGTDPDTDLALIQINAANLPYANFGNSDLLRVGEWVLAVGNPFNLNSTVTAGIVCAKGRSLGLIEGETAIESFIQTDAAVNQGSSGGALVNLRGELVGVNTAIATSHGQYSGFSFAIPANLTQKIINDLRYYGNVQRAVLGASVQNIDENMRQQLLLKNTRGVYVAGVSRGSAAESAKLQQGDVIIEINGFVVNSTADYQEKIANFRPGEIVSLTVWRKGKEYFTDIMLRNTNQGEGLLTDNRIEMENLLGAKLEEMPTNELNRLGLRHGIRLIRLNAGLLQNNTTMRSNFIINRINNESVKSVEDFFNQLAQLHSGDAVILEGVYPGTPKLVRYGFTWKR
ncbi:MAG: trypsin-like peptidase domain-containing protein [Sphingobacteriales bacterium]|nr:trypsin-like peptidase domain-containing protein [Sphingobacteriales bacterium]